MLSCYQSPVNCRSRNVEDNFTYKVNYNYYCHFQGLDLCSYQKAPSQGWEEGWILKIAYFLENYIGHVVIFKVDVVCCTKQGKKTHALWGIS